jgi:hypothetical protein
LTQADLTNLTGTWFNRACGITNTSAIVSGLLCGTQYYFRVWAAGFEESGYTPIASVTTSLCDFEPPDDLNVSVAGEGHVVFLWDEEDPALWFCVDIATSEADLIGYSASWRNFDCGDTDETADITDEYFECGETYFWRVYAFAGTASGHSSVDSFTIEC